MTTTLQPARPDHAAAIASIQRAIWPTESSDESQIAAAIADADHRTTIALVEARIAGFVDGFKTHSASGQLRWEVDLLAVHPDYHSRKIGQQLIAESTQQARQLGAAVARGLVQVDNVPSQRAFQRCGYESDQTVYTLMVADAKPSLVSASLKNAHLVPVNTLNYRGLWLEGDLTPDTLAAAQAACARLECAVVGTLIPVNDQGRLNVAAKNGYSAVSHYQWWLSPL